MKEIPEFHSSKNCKLPIYGYRLEVGDEIKKGDMYDSWCGIWQPSDLPRLKIQKYSNMIYIRPTSLSLIVSKIKEKF